MKKNEPSLSLIRVYFVLDYTHAHTHACTHTRTHTHTRMHTHTHTHTHTRTHTHTHYTRTHICYTSTQCLYPLHLFSFSLSRTLTDYVKRAFPDAEYTSLQRALTSKCCEERRKIKKEFNVGTCPLVSTAPSNVVSLNSTTYT